MADSRAVLWLGSGILGLALGVAGAAWHAVALSILAGACALVAGIAGYRLVGLLRERSREVDLLSTQLDEIESARQLDAEHLAKAQGEFDAAVFAARIERTSFRSDPAPEPLIESLTDDLTGLFSEAYFLVAADARIASARRNLHPVAIVLLEVIEDLHGSLPHPADPVVVAGCIHATLRESDTPCRLGNGGYGLLLEDTPENGAIWTVERLRRHMAQQNPQLTIWAGIACYPAHAFQIEELLDRASLALSLAREWRQDRIEVASAE